MNTVKTLLSGIAILFVAYLGFAAGSRSTLNVDVTGEKTFELELTNVNGKMTVYLTDKDAKVYHENSLKVQDDLKMTFDVSDLENGVYTLVMRDELKLQAMPVVVTADQIEVKTQELSKVFFPQIDAENDVVLVKMLSDDTNALNIKIESDNGELLYEEDLEGKVGLIGQKFKFSGGGYYKMTLTSKDYSEVKFFSPF